MLCGRRLRQWLRRGLWSGVRTERDARLGLVPVRLNVRGPVAIATHAAKPSVAGLVARLAAEAAGPAVIRAGDPCGDGCCEHCWHRGPISFLFALFTPAAGVGRGVASDIGVISTAIRPIVGTRATATATTLAADAITAASGCQNGSGGYVDQGTAASGEKIISQTDQAVGPSGENDSAAAQGRETATGTIDAGHRGRFLDGVIF